MEANNQPDYIDRGYKNDITGLMIAAIENKYDDVVHQIEVLKVS